MAGEVRTESPSRPPRATRSRLHHRIGGELATTSARPAQPPPRLRTTPPHSAAVRARHRRACPDWGPAPSARPTNGNGAGWGGGRTRTESTNVVRRRGSWPRPTFAVRGWRNVARVRFGAHARDVGVPGKHERRPRPPIAHPVDVERGPPAHS